ncbi:MAG: epoxyqueuosine reductase, partial [Planctomycetota bacterium]
MHDLSSAEELKAMARDLGFARTGIATAGPSPHGERYLEWLEAGRHGTMTYMAKHVARRLDPRETLSDARSVVVTALPYRDEVPFPEEKDHTRGKIARYARGRDYHKVITPLLRRL